MDRKYDVIALLIVAALVLGWKRNPISRYLNPRLRRSSGGAQEASQRALTTPAEAASIAVDESLSTPISS